MELGDPAPWHYRFEDYDLLGKAAANGLNVNLSMLSAVYPYWIHRVEPGSEVITNFGHKVKMNTGAGPFAGIRIAGPPGTGSWNLSSLVR